MRWAHPYCLILGPAAIAATLYAWRELEIRKAALTYPAVSELISLVSTARTLWARIFPYAAKTTVLVLMAFALARPQWASRQVAGLTQGIDILLVLDTSTSMLAIDFDPLNRIGAAKNAAKEFISHRLSDRIGILAFGGSPALTCPLTLDYDALLEFLDQVYAGMTQTEGTAIGDAIAAGVNHLKESAAKSKVMILLTDGSNNTGIVDPITAAKAAQAFGIKIYAIGAAKRGKAYVPVDNPIVGRQLVPIPDELDEDLLLNIAAQTGGKYFRATNLKELSEIYKEIDRMEKTDVKLPELTSYRDFYPWLLVPAALLLALEILLSQTLLMRIP